MEFQDQTPFIAVEERKKRLPLRLEIERRRRQTERDVLTGLSECEDLIDPPTKLQQRLHGEDRRRDTNG